MFLANANKGDIGSICTHILTQSRYRNLRYFLRYKFNIYVCLIIFYHINLICMRIRIATIGNK